MTEHVCTRCGPLRSSVSEQRDEIRHLLNIIESRPDSPIAASAKSRLTKVKQRMHQTQAILRDHVEQASS